MRKKSIIWAFVFASIIGLTLILWKHVPAKPTETVPPVVQTSVLNPTTPVSAALAVPQLQYEQLSTKTMSVEEATQIYVQRLRADPMFEGKVALNFYGKVVDEAGQPVAGAKVHYEWNTLGVAGGTAIGDDTSDVAGLFSLTGKRGKLLSVHVEKEGYYSVNNGNGTAYFEFADPSSPNWYEPEKDHPALFHLLKRGMGVKLFSKTINLSLNKKHQQERVDFMRGFILPDGVLSVSLDTSKEIPGAQAFPWTVTLNMSEGGLVETSEQFAFVAPLSGYSSTVKMDMTNTDRSVWRGEMVKKYYFFLPSTNTYGRVTIDASASLPLSVDYVYNLVPGDRGLEPSNQ